MSAVAPRSADIQRVDDGAPRVSLILRRHGVNERHIPCRRAVTLLGARDGCKIRLEHSAVSAVHAAILNTGSDVILVDLGSRHGTLLNGLRVEHDTLRNDDVVTLEPFEFLVRIEDGIHGAGADGNGFVKLDPAPDVIALEHIATSRLLSPTRDACTIGRKSTCDIQLTDGSVSRVHAVLFKYNGHPTIVDLLSENGTLVNDEPVTLAELHDGDALTIGETLFRVRLASHQALKKLGANGASADGNGEVVKPSGDLAAPGHVDDLIDIQSVEGSQRWKIVDAYNKVARKR